MCEVDGGLGGKTREVTHSVQILGTFVLSIWIRMAISSGDWIGCGENDKDFLNSCPCDNEMGLVERGNCGGRRCDQVELKSLLFVPFNCWYDEPLFWVTYKFNGLRIKIVSFMICVIYCVAFYCFCARVVVVACGGGGALQVFVQVQSYVIAQRSPC